jgi:hypothetical protein
MTLGVSGLAASDQTVAVRLGKTSGPEVPKIEPGKGKPEESPSRAAHTGQYRLPVREKQAKKSL